MDGSKNPIEIHKATGIDQGGLSRLPKLLRSNELLAADEKRPKLLLSIPSDFFEKAES
jgi:hypothetical protein